MFIIYTLNSGRGRGFWKQVCGIVLWNDCDIEFLHFVFIVWVNKLDSNLAIWFAFYKF